MLDELKINCIAGQGGDGCLHFKTNKFNFKGGPDGGNGGDGGSIIILGDNRLQSLSHLQKINKFKAEDGFNGSTNFKKGATGKNVIIKVPINTGIKDVNNKLLFKVLFHKQKYIIFKGGLGGYGNAFFKNSIFRSPVKYTKGKKGEKGLVILEFTLRSDVAIIGEPNTGKSTLLSYLTSAKPQIGDYSFTSLNVNLGVIYTHNSKYLIKSLVVSDVPGIIKGACFGKGLGLKFLRHLFDNTILLIAIPINIYHPQEYLDMILNELYIYDVTLLKKTIILLITKSDLFDLKYHKEFIDKIKTNYVIIFISCLNGYGLDLLRQKIFDIFNNK
jgi:GTP-binding protein